MEILIGIIAIILVVIFWRIFLPLSIVIVIGFAGLIGYDRIQTEKAEKERAAIKTLLQERVRAAQESASPEGKVWLISTYTDPASGSRIAGRAFIQSNDGLCKLDVENRVDGTELTGLYCNGFTVNQYRDILVKFDNWAQPREMEVSTFSNSSDVYIKSYQSSSNLKYEDWLLHLTSSNVVAIRVSVKQGFDFWTSFSLKGSNKAINQLGKPL